MLRTEFSRAGRCQWDAENPGVPHPLDVTARLDELRNMKDGWLDGDGIAPPHAGLDWLADAFDSHYPDDAPLPYIYPTPEGGVQMEWLLGPFEISLEINLASHSAEWFWVEIPTDAEDERVLNLDEASAWDWFAAEIRRLAPAPQNEPGHSALPADTFVVGQGRPDYIPSLSPNAKGP